MTKVVGKPSMCGRGRFSCFALQPAHCTKPGMSDPTTTAAIAILETFTRDAELRAPHLRDPVRAGDSKATASLPDVAFTPSGAPFRPPKYRIRIGSSVR